MVDSTDHDMAAGGRHVYGPRPIGALVPGLTRAAFRKRSPAAAQLLADWDMIVGPALARQTSPRRLHGGTLTIACSGPVGLELQHLAGELIERINRHMGGRTVARLRLVQAPAVVGLPRQARPPSPLALAAAECATASVSPGPLREALVALGQVVLSNPPVLDRNP